MTPIFEEAKINYFFFAAFTSSFAIFWFVSKCATEIIHIAVFTQSSQNITVQ